MLSAITTTIPQILKSKITIKITTTQLHSPIKRTTHLYLSSPSCLPTTQKRSLLSRNKNHFSNWMPTTFKVNKLLTMLPITSLTPLLTTNISSLFQEWRFKKVELHPIRQYFSKDLTFRTKVIGKCLMSLRENRAYLTIREEIRTSINKIL